MTHKIEISAELNEYFSDTSTAAAVDFIAGASKKTWSDLSVNEFVDADFKEYKTSEYVNYSNAWIYTKKVQKDYFDFMGHIWKLTWGNSLQGKFSDLIIPVSFHDIETVFKKRVGSEKST